MMVVRTSILRTFGFIVLVIGLVLTIYGHIADRSCTDCDDDGNSNGVYVSPKFSPAPESQHTESDGDYHDGYYDHHPPPPPPPPPKPQNSSPQVNLKAIRYAKMLGPIAFVVGLVFIVFSVFLERKLKLKESANISHKVHWTEEIMNTHSNANDGQQTRSANNQIVVAASTAATTTTTIATNTETQTPAYTSICVGDLPKTSIIDPPPAYEDTVIDVVLRADNNKTLTTLDEQPPSYSSL